MEFHFLSSFVAILRESQVIFVKNRNLMASISLFILLLHSSLLLCNFFSFKPLFKDFITQESLYLQLTSPGSPEYTTILLAMAKDVRLFMGLAWFFILAFSIVSLFSSTATILASAIIYGERSLCFKDLLLTGLKSWKRTLTTWFYIALFDIGFIFFAFFSFLPLVVPIKMTISNYLILIIVLSFYAYLGVYWNLSIVIAVLEEKCGLEAIGKATQLAMGMKLQGFLLNVLFGILGFLLYYSWSLVSVKSEAFILLMALLISNIGCLIKMQAWMAFTVFYHLCKQSHGEEIELQGALEYTKAPTQPLITAEIP
ncbi:hypothetical protein L6164_014116 [Bauhinia variegata]|uniref:Uncharacterized protein n=1 Tax=Bauhinia variegata TaxID=167791 RepID=A0ACB9NG81_BAUVA|nr:hypothetical protein L6164_014116 [Bauhinia variegata]